MEFWKIWNLNPYDKSIKCKNSTIKYTLKEVVAKNMGPKQISNNF